jgi:hypothetical protein
MGTGAPPSTITGNVESPKSAASGLSAVDVPELLIEPEFELPADPLSPPPLPEGALVVLPLVGATEVVPLADADVAPAEDPPLLVPEEGAASVDPPWVSAPWPDADEAAAEPWG